VTLSFVDMLIALTYLLTYSVTCSIRSVLATGSVALHTRCPVQMSVFYCVTVYMMTTLCVCDDDDDDDA